MKKSKNITGIILSGGQSSRMKEEKGLCLLNGKPMIEHIIDALTPICSEILISTNNNAYAYLGYPQVKDMFHNIGPINGIYAGLAASRNDDNLILSCDIPLVSTELINHIYISRNGFDIAIPRIGEFYEPLCAYYNRSILGDIESAINSKSYKLISLIKSLNYTEVEIKESLPFFHEDLFENVNSPADLKKVEISLQR